MKPTASRGAGDVIPASDREHLLTVLFGLWMTVGLFLDGYFHQNLKTDAESFLTPWHGVFYFGFAASVVWLSRMSRRRSAGEADWSLRFLPPGYDGARIGIGLFALGGAGDAAWHTAFGVERGVDALLSPTHLVLFVGLVMILTAPLRAARIGPSPRPWVVVGSLTSATALVGFFLNFAWGLGVSALARVPYDPVTEAGEVQVVAGVAGMVVTTGVLFGAARVLLRAARVPAGAFTVLFGVVAALVSAAFDEDFEGVVAALVAGVALDVLLRVVRPGHATVAVVFGGTAAGLWLVYLGLLAGLNGIEWQAEVWMGGAVLSAIAAYAIAALDFSPGTVVSPLGVPALREDSGTDAVRRRYAALAVGAAEGGTCCTPAERDVFGASQYAADDLLLLPEIAAAASIGCGNPTAVAELAPGEVVLDLGSGGGIDVILSARRVGPSGKAYGLDMTDEMLELARRNASTAGVDNVEFLRGHIEEIPLPDESVDVVISNCAINLSTDKAAVIVEAARVLRPGGRFAVSDVVADAELDEAARARIDEWTGCVAGALTSDDYMALLIRAGLVGIEIVETHPVHAHASAAIVRAHKPTAV